MRSPLSTASAFVNRARARCADFCRRQVRRLLCGEEGRMRRESVNTLMFASSAKNIEINPELNQKLSRRGMLRVNKTLEMDGFGVTAFEANHIYGAVMLLFEGTAISGGSYLCTGDFRADEHFYAQPSTILALQKRTIGTIHLDNTYLDSSVDVFVSKEESLKQTVTKIATAPEDSIIYFVTNGVGRERFLLQLVQELGEQISLDEKRWEVAKVMGISEYFLQPDVPTRLRTCRRMDVKTLLHLDKNAFFIELTMLSAIKEGFVIPHGRSVLVDYSDHCSPSELRYFLSHLAFRKIVCHQPLSQERLNELQSLSQIDADQELTAQGDTSSDADPDDGEVVQREEITGAFDSKNDMDMMNKVVNKLILRPYNLPDGEVPKGMSEPDFAKLVVKQLDMDRLVVNIDAGAINMARNEAESTVEREENNLKCFEGTPWERLESYRAFDRTMTEPVQHVDSNVETRGVELVMNDNCENEAFLQKVIEEANREANREAIELMRVLYGVDMG